MGARGPNLKSYLDKNVALSLSKNRKVQGTLRGYDQFMNLVLADAKEELSDKSLSEIGMIVIRGSSVLQVELLN